MAINEALAINEAMAINEALAINEAMAINEEVPMAGPKVLPHFPPTEQRLQVKLSRMAGPPQQVRHLMDGEQVVLEGCEGGL